MVKKLIVTLIGCLIPLTSIFAQTGKVTVTGVVIDEDSVPVAGAGIVLKGTTIGTFTDADGNFTLETDDVPDMTREARDCDGDGPERTGPGGCDGYLQQGPGKLYRFGGDDERRGHKESLLDQYRKGYQRNRPEFPRDGQLRDGV